jgi:hypothetical protein
MQPKRGILSVDVFLSDRPVRSIVFEPEIHSKRWVVDATRRVERILAR